MNLPPRGLSATYVPGTCIAQTKLVMTIFRRIIFILLSVIFVFGAGCTSKAQRDSDNEYDRARDMIGQGRYEEVMALMGHKLKNNSQDMTARLLLANAYAARAGVFASGFTDFAAEIIQSSREVDAIVGRNGGLFEQLKGKGDREAKIVIAFERFMIATLRVDGLLRGFRALPQVKSAVALRDLETALQILDQEQRYRGGPAIYRGLLRVTYFKQNLKGRYDFSSIHKCSINAGALAEQISRLRDDVRKILFDIGYGTLNENRQIELEEFTEKIDLEMRTAIQALRRFDENSLDVSMIVRQLDGGCRE
jgi:hypothetical protein